MPLPTVTPRPTSTRSIFENRVNRLFRITFLGLAGILMPHDIQAQDVGDIKSHYVGEMHGFWRRASMVDTYLKGGGGLGYIPDYVTDSRSSFPYRKRDKFTTEYPHADSLILVRTLGGWHKKNLGNGEAAKYSRIEEADVVTWVDKKLQFDKDKFLARIQPYVDKGYSDLTIVLDNIPWSLSHEYEQDKYGNKGHALYPTHMYWVGKRVSQCLVERFGENAKNFTFRYLTEPESGPRYTGTAKNYFDEYKNLAEGLRCHLPDAKLGPGNFFILNKAGQGTMKLEDFLVLVRDAGAERPLVDFLSASRYLKTTEKGVAESPAAVVKATMDYFDKLQNDYSTVLKNADWKIDEFGFVGDARASGGTLHAAQPGAYGGALVFNMICGLLERNIYQMQHWLAPMVYDGNMSGTEGANTTLWTSLSSIFTIFDHLRGGQAYVRSITGLLNDAEGMSLVVKKDQCTYIILSAANVSRSIQPKQIFTYSFPETEATFKNPARVKIEYLSLDRSTVPHDILRNDLANNNLLVDPFSNNADWVSDVNSMAGTKGRQYLNQNFGTYSKAYIDAMTLKPYKGSLTRNETNFELKVNKMKTPSIMVFRLSPQPETIYDNEFDDATGTEAKNSNAEVRKITQYTAYSDLTATDGAGKLHATASDPAANYRFRMRDTNLNDASPKLHGVRATIKMRAPRDEWVGISFGENGAGQVLHADTNATWLMVGKDFLSIRGGEGGSREGAVNRYSSTHGAGDTLSIEYIYYFDQTVDLYLDGKPIAKNVPVTYFNAENQKKTKPGIKWFGVTLRKQPTSANGGAYIDRLIIDLLP